MNVAQMVTIIGERGHAAPMIRDGGRSVWWVMALLVLVGSMAGGEVRAAAIDACTDAARADVLFQSSEGGVHWVCVRVQGMVDGLQVARSASNVSGVALAWEDDSHFGAFVTAVGGVVAPADFSWWWSLWVWDAANGSWATSQVGLSDLRPADGLVLALAPSWSGPPLATPAHPFPWVSGAVAVGPARDSVEVWSLDLQAGPLWAPPLVVDGVAYVAGGGDKDWATGAWAVEPKVVAVDLVEGQRLWSKTVDGVGWQNAPPRLVAGALIVPTTAGTIWALDPRTGATLWTAATAAMGNGINQPVLGLHTFEGAVAVVAEETGWVRAVSVTDGSTVWRTAVAASNDTAIYHSAPVYVDGQILVGDEAGTLHALDAGNGSEVWNLTFGGSIRSTVAADDGWLWFTNSTVEGYSSVNGSLFGVEMANRSHIVEVVVGAGPSSPVAVDGTVHVSGGARHWWVDGGTVIRSMAGTYGSQPVVGPDGILLSVNEDGGGLLWVARDLSLVQSLGGETGWNQAPAASTDTGIAQVTSDGRLRLLAEAHIEPSVVDEPAGLPDVGALLSVGMLCLAALAGRAVSPASADPSGSGQPPRRSA